MPIRFMIFALGLCSTLAVGADAPRPIIQTIPAGVRFGVWPAVPTQPMPTLFIFSGAIEDALGTATYRQAGNLLGEKGVLCVSLDLPCHGLDEQPKEKGLSGWRTRISRDDDIVAKFVSQVQQVLDHLIDQRWTDPMRVAASGTSRGGFIALHLAAAEPRIRCAVGYAPVTDLIALSEFKGLNDHALVQKLALRQQAAALATKPIWMVIGDRDARVDTDKAVELARLITKAGLDQSLSPQVDFLLLAEPRGHTTPTGAVNLAADWLWKQLRP